MFDTIVNKSAGHPRARWTTAVVSASAHLVALMAIVLSTLYATDTLPDPRSMTVFVTSAPLPPPPPPPVVAEAPKPVAQRVARPRPAPAKPAPAMLQRVAAPAPVEAPAGVAAETGLEGGQSSIEAGFERGIGGEVAGGIIGGFETSLPAPPPAPKAPIRIGGAVAAPALIHRVEPEYPVMAQTAQIEGVVILEATVNRDGRVEDLRVLRSHNLLEAAARDAVMQWRYEPLLLNGNPTPFVLTVTVSFGLAR